MSRRRQLSIAGALALGLALPFLAAQVGPSGGLPSQPRFQAVTVGAGDKAGTGQIRTHTAAVGYRHSAGDARLCLEENDATAGNQSWYLQAVNEGFRIRTAADGCSVSGAGTPLQIERTGATVDSIALAATSITANGAEVVGQTSGTFTASLTTACSTTPTVDFKWTKQGNIVTLMATQAVSCTSDSTTTAYDAGSLPASIRPAANQCAGIIPAVNNAVNGYGAIRLETGGGINVALAPAGSTTACSGTGWTASGTKGVGQWVATYVVN